MMFSVKITVFCLQKSSTSRKVRAFESGCPSSFEFGKRGADCFPVIISSGII